MGHVQQELDRLVSMYLNSMVNHHLIRLTQHPDTQDERLPDIWLMREPNSMMFSTYIGFLPGNVIGIWGDFCPLLHGVVSTRPYDLAWFGSQKCPSYLSEKFLMKQFDADRAKLQAKDRLDFAKKEHDVLDIKYFQRVVEILDSELDIFPQQAVYEAGEEIYRDYFDPELVPGYGYKLTEQAPLVSIQRKFHELYETWLPEEQTVEAAS